jgi:hypothetical protein
MVCFQTKNPNLGTFWRALKWKMQVYFRVIWNIWPFGNVGAIWYIFPRFGILCQEKSGNPGLDSTWLKLPPNHFLCPKQNLWFPARWNFLFAVWLMTLLGKSSTPISNFNSAPKTGSRLFKLVKFHPPSLSSICMHVCMYSWEWI